MFPVVRTPHLALWEGGRDAGSRLRLGLRVRHAKNWLKIELNGKL
jgi:hypothetical protein